MLLHCWLTHLCNCVEIIWIYYLGVCSLALLFTSHHSESPLHCFFTQVQPLSPRNLPRTSETIFLNPSLKLLIFFLILCTVFEILVTDATHALDISSWKYTNHLCTASSHRGSYLFLAISQHSENSWYWIPPWRHSSYFLATSPASETPVLTPCLRSPQFWWTLGYEASQKSLTSIIPIKIYEFWPLKHVSNLTL